MFIDKDLGNKFLTEKTGKGWEIIKIKTVAGEDVKAVAPLIISASRRNDTPACHSHWFMEGLRRGYLGVLNKYVSLKNARLIVFWTKNPDPIIDHLNEIDNLGIGYYFQHTLNNYESEGLEPNLPPLEGRIATFQKLSGMIGKEKVIWRFDPLILTDTITKEMLVEKVEKLMQQLTGYTKKLVISFYRSDDYKHALIRMQANQIYPRNFEGEDISFVASKLGALGEKYNIRISTCADKGDLSFFGIEPNKCVDDELIKQVFSDDKVLMTFLESRKKLKDPGQRAECQCIVSEDVGSNSTCANGCLYCYANKSDAAVARNFKKIETGGIGEFLKPRSLKKLKN